MIAPTHMGFGVFTALLFGSGPLGAVVAMFGSLLPDLDAPNSYLGRMVPGTQWINEKFGHRGAIHGLILWVPLLVIGWGFEWWRWLMVGALSHCVIDTMTLGGVKLFWPSKLLVVFGPRTRRMKVGSPVDLVFGLFIWLCAGGLWWVHDHGGWRLVLGFVGSYDVAVKTIIKADSQGFDLKGDWKLLSGDLLKDQGYLVIGWEATKGVGTRLALWDDQNKRILRPYEDIIPVWVKAQPLEWSWASIPTSKPVKAVGDVFYRTGDKWHFGQAGDIVIGVLKWKVNDKT